MGQIRSAAAGGAEGQGASWRRRVGAGAYPDGPEALAELQSDPVYRQVLKFIREQDWPAAEGLLLLLRQRYDSRVVYSIDSLLGYSLSMQAHHGEAWLVLEPLLACPDRTFWLAHLCADTKRGLGEGEAAAALYRQALKEGSDSSITVRNLIQVLLQQEGSTALEQLEQWHQQGLLQGFVLEGVREALVGALAPELEIWLDHVGLAGPSQLRRLLEEDLRRLDLEAVRARLGQLVWQGDPWRQAVESRLAHLGLSA